jgi:hypothetical protein
MIIEILLTFAPICRNATRVEDVAYSLLGIFDVNMPLLYGEGKRAFIRLQEEIMKHSDDQSLFAWGDIHDFTGVGQEGGKQSLIQSSYGFLAESPSDYRFSNDVLSFSTPQDQVWITTNKGIQVDFPSFKSNGETIIVLNCYLSNDLRKCLSIPCGGAVPARCNRVSRNLFLIDHRTVTLRHQRYYLSKSYREDRSDLDRTGGLYFGHHSHYSIAPLSLSDRWQQNSQVFLQPRDKPKQWDALFIMQSSDELEHVKDGDARFLVSIGVKNNIPWCEITTYYPEWFQPKEESYQTVDRRRFPESSTWFKSMLMRVSVRPETVMGQEMFAVEISKPQPMSFEEFGKGSARLIQGNLLPAINVVGKATAAGLSKALSSTLKDKKK